MFNPALCKSWSSCVGEREREREGWVCREQRWVGGGVSGRGFFLAVLRSPGSAAMAGMLPGVECARRRRFHQGGAMELQSGTRRSSFCLYRSGHESHLSSSSVHRSAFNMSTQSEGLGDAAREARERLDERLRAQRTSEIRRHNSTGSLRPGSGSSGDNNNQGMVSSAALAKLQKEVFCSKKSSRHKFSWSRLGWKAADQDDCAVCLEEFKGGDILVHLPCAHRFHWRCVLPWLQSSPHCPCCRTEITS